MMTTGSDGGEASSMVDDIPLLCVIGMPRSGTIWTTRLLGQAVDSPTQTRYSPQPFAYDRDPAVWGEDRPGGLIRRLHKPSDAMPYDCPVVLVVRDPRDITVSQSYFYGKEPNSHFRYILGNWLRYYRDWLKDKRLATITRYEDLHANPQVELNILIMDLHRLDVELHTIPDSKQIAKAVHDNSFRKMENWAKRKGQVGDWKTHLSVESIALWKKTQKEYGIVYELGYME